jgi:methyl-accepting chemotaxis protein
MLNKLRIKAKLLGAFIIVSLIPLGIVTYIAVSKAGGALQNEAVAKFTAIQETKANHIQDYLASLRTSVKIIKNDPYLIQCATSFNEAYEGNGNTVENDSWQFIVAFREPRIKDMVADFGYDDLLLISPSGNVIYTVGKQSDLGMNVAGSELAGTSLGKAFVQLQKAGDDDEVLITDFADYVNKQQAAFMGARLENDFGNAVGYVAVKLPAAQINAIVQSRSGLGQTGESYLVGKSGDQTGLRSDRVVKGGKIGDAETDEYIELALSGRSGSAVKLDVGGSSAFVRYDPVTIDGLNWGLLTTVATEEVFAAVNTLRNTILMVIVAVIVAVVALAMSVTALIVKPINGAVKMLKDIAEGEGDLTKRLNVDSHDEIGEMASWFNAFMDKLQAIIRQIAGDAATLTEASSTLSAISGQMTTGAENMSGRSGQVAASAEEMSANLNSVAAASEQAAGNVNMVASAAEEMTATVNEIARNSEKAHAITESAVTKAGGASVKVDELGRAANEISRVTEVITEISEQINLLALNATIEAARAGDAGKGFAVVANEIKELAKQTAQATQDIKTRIGAIQGSTADTVSRIEEISSVIHEVNDIVATIATAVEEQAVTSQEIANNVAQASLGIQEVNTNVNQSSSVAGTISGDIAEVNVSVQEMAYSSGQVNQSAEGLSALSDKLRELVGRFKV